MVKVRPGEKFFEFGQFCPYGVKEDFGVSLKEIWYTVIFCETGAPLRTFSNKLEAESESRCLNERSCIEGLFKLFAGSKVGSEKFREYISGINL